MSLTEKEIQLEIDKNYFIGSLQWKKNNLSYEDLKSFMPKESMLSFVNKDSFGLIHLCERGQETMEKSLEEIKSIGAEYTQMITHPDSIKTVFPEFQHYFKFGDHHRPFVRFQKLRKSASQDYFLVRTCKLANYERDVFINMHIPIAELAQPSSIKKHVDREVEFAHQNYHKFYKLNPLEKRILALLGDGLRPKDVADKLNTGYENIRKYIKGINVKLELVGSSHNKAAIYTKYAIYFHLI